MSLATPEKIQTLQRKLYLKAKRDPSYRFYALYDKVYRADVLDYAYRLCRANGGAPGVDGQGIEEVVAAARQLTPRLRKTLLDGSYRPGDIRRVWIPKPGGGQRCVGHSSR